MGWDDVGAGIAGGLDSFLKTLSWQKEYEQTDRKIESDARTKELQAEIRAMIATMNERGRSDRWSTPSANVVTTQAAQTARNTDDNTTATTIAEGRNAVTSRGQDLNHALGLTRNETTRRGQDFGFTLGGMRDTTARRGQDMTAGTARRGQDISRELGLTFETGRTTRAADANTLRVQENEKDREVDLERIRRRANPFEGLFEDGDDPLREVVDGTGRPTAEPIEVMDPPTDDRPLPRSPEADADQSQQMETQARSLMEQFRKEADPARRAALRSQLQRLRDQLAQKTPGGR